MDLRHSILHPYNYTLFPHRVSKPHLRAFHYWLCLHHECDVGGGHFADAVVHFAGEDAGVVSVGSQHRQRRLLPPEDESRG